ncbi:VOC family protein [Azospirillum halopraeferens]|uniref:VOC family protein n=1 Tax=Azospirillum halopraeferens TaxID=34010 RepID=UPI0003F8CFD2|nr:VOC family protein [Azospirillum halopraeferens]
MSGFFGRFVWYELMTTDPAAATAFHGAVAGWRGRDSGMPGFDYTLLSAGEAQGAPGCTDVGGVMALPEEACAAGARPGWLGYIAVDDVDATADRIWKAGGAVHRPPADIPGIGRFAVVADPQGAVFALFRPAPGSGDGAPPVPPREPGRFAWHELVTDDHEAAFAFYADLFGWQALDSVDIGPMGTYRIFGRDGEAMGGMMNRCEGMPGPFWLYYVMVDGIDAAAERVKAGGGTVINGPMEVPGGSWIIQCLDPQHAPFALVGPRS